MEGRKPLTNGPAAAAILASGIGSLALGLSTTLAQAIAQLKEALIFYSPSGSLSGETTVAVAVWLVSWAVLHVLWRRDNVDFSKVFISTIALVLMGLIGTFPPFFQTFGG